MKITESILQVFQHLCGEDQEQFQKFEDSILNNSIKLEKKMDEMTYLLNIAKDQVLFLQENSAIIHLCFDIVMHLVLSQLNYQTKTLEDNEETTALPPSPNDWYKKYSYVLLYEVKEF